MTAPLGVPNHTHTHTYNQPPPHQPTTNPLLTVPVVLGVAQHGVPGLEHPLLGELVVVPQLRDLLIGVRWCWYCVSVIGGGRPHTWACACTQAGSPCVLRSYLVVEPVGVEHHQDAKVARALDDLVEDPPARHPVQLAVLEISPHGCVVVQRPLGRPGEAQRVEAGVPQELQDVVQGPLLQSEEHALLQLKTKPADPHQMEGLPVHLDLLAVGRPGQRLRAEVDDPVRGGIAVVVRVRVNDGARGARGGRGGGGGQDAAQVRLLRLAGVGARMREEGEGPLCVRACVCVLMDAGCQMRLRLSIDRRIDRSIESIELCAVRASGCALAALLAHAPGSRGGGGC